MKEELLSLIQSSKALINYKISCNVPPFFEVKGYDGPACPSPVSPPSQTRYQSAPPPLKKPSQPPPPTLTPPPQIKKPLSPPPTSMMTFLQKLDPSFPLKAPPTPVIIFAPQQLPNVLPFLQKVEQAIRPLLGEGSIVHELEKTHLTSPLVKWILAPPTPLLTSQCGELTPLQPVLLPSKAQVLPLHELTSYLSNVELKRTLWNTIKTLASK